VRIAVWAGILVLLCAAIVGLAGCERTAVPPPTQVSVESHRAPAGIVAAPKITYPETGPGTLEIATAGGPVAGSSGTLLRYRVAVEQGITGITPAAFARAVSAVLSDPRSWTGTGAWQLQPVPDGAPYDFTIALVTPATRDVLCQDGDDRYTSCRKGDLVVLNVARWVGGAPSFGNDLVGYRQYMVNHETGHLLGYGHELCARPGVLAPVMQQQTLGLHGCLPNSWPMVDGVPYDGAPGEYSDPLPS
jgi:hypothetical protein